MATLASDLRITFSLGNGLAFIGKGQVLGKGLAMVEILGSDKGFGLWKSSRIDLSLCTLGMEWEKENIDGLFKKKNN